MGKGKKFCNEYEANAKHICKNIEDNPTTNKRATNKTPKKKKRK